LGPVVYGNFDLLTDYANRIINFLDGGVSVAFYTKLSQDKTNKTLVRYYGWLVLIVSMIYFFFVLATVFNTIYHVVWPGQEFTHIVLSALLGIITFCSNGALRMVDACDLTIKGERVKMVQLLISIVVFGGAFLIFKQTSLAEFYYIHIFLIIGLFGGNYYILKRAGFSIFPSVKLKKADINFYSRSFWEYSNPLILSGIITLVAGLGGRWILQLYGGSMQQGFFALSYKVSTFVFLFTGAMMPLLMREVSLSFGKNEFENIRSLFIKNLKILYFLVTFMAVYVSLNSDFITTILGGKGFEEAGIVVGLMAFYPVHQTIGQINGTIYMSTERTKGYRNINLVFSPLSIVFSYFFMAPVSAFGLGLGAVGLAIEMIVIQFISQNVLLYFNCKYLNFSFIRLFLYQIVIIALLLLSGWFEKCAIELLFENVFIRGITHFAVFTMSLVGYVYLFPRLIGISHRKELLRVFKL
jgi:O-antigen/teichoic acid export membrane protein